MSTEKRVVETQYTAKDAGHGTVLAGLVHRAEQAGQHFLHLRERMGEFRREQGFTLLATLGLGYGFGSLIEKAKHAQREFGGTEKRIASLLATSLAFEKSATDVDRYSRSMVLAREVTERLDETSARFLMELGETESIYRKVAITAGGLGLKQQEVLELTESVAAAARQFGVSGEQAANTIARAMSTRTVRGVDEFSLSMKKALGNLKGLSNEQVFERVQKSLKGSVAIADAMSGGIAGAIARVRNVAEDTLRDITRPIFGEVAKRLEAWSKHLREARASGKSLVTEVGDKLLVAFNKLAEISKFVSEHWKSVAAIIGGLKVAEFAGARAQMLQGAAGLAGVGGKAAGALKVLSANIAVLGAAYFAGSAIGELIGRDVGEDVQNRGKATSALSNLRLLQAVGDRFATAPQGQLDAQGARIGAKTVKSLEDLGLVKEGKLSREAVRGVFEHADRTELRHVLDLFSSKTGLDLQMRRGRVPEAAVDALTSRLQQNFSALIAQFSTQAKALTKPNDENRPFAKNVNNFYGGVHVTMKFDDEADPDRVMVRAVDEINQLADRRTQSQLADPLGD